MATYAPIDYTPVMWDDAYSSLQRFLSEPIMRIPQYSHKGYIGVPNVPAAFAAVSDILGALDPYGVAGFISGPRGFKIGKQPKVSKVVSTGKKISKEDIVRAREMEDLIRSEIHKIIRSGKKGPSRVGGGRTESLLDFLKMGE